MCNIFFLIATQFVTKVKSTNFNPYALSLKFISKKKYKKFIFLCFHIKMHVLIWDKLKNV
jgi:hypothetical protein